MFTKVFIICTLVFAFFGTLSASDVYSDPELCDEACYVFYNPVCSTDGHYYREFRNECELKAYNCKLQQSLMKPYVITDLDMCRTEFVNGLDKLLVKLGNLKMDRPECLKPCPKNYDPVCISNGKYRSLAANTCIMDIINCALDGKSVFKVVQRQTC